MLYGGSNAGKTFLICRYIVLRALKYPKSTHLIARLTLADAKKKVYYETLYPIIETLIHKNIVKVNIQEGIIRFKNGSIIYLGGLQQYEIDRILGPKYATIFINECSEVSYLAYEILSTRLYSAATNNNGKIEEKLIIDQNPTISQHWSNVLFNQAIDPRDKVPRSDKDDFGVIHFTPYDNVENIGQRYIDKLLNMSEDMKRRFVEGKFGTYSGLVYILKDTDIVDDFEMPSYYRKYRAIDFGFVHPFVCLYLAYDESNERAYIYREYSHTRLTVRQHSIELNKHVERYISTVADHDSEDRATLEENKIFTRPANKSIKAGIDLVTDLLERGKLKIFRSCVKTIDEFYTYRWKDGSVKDKEPIKKGDDHMDALRYGCMEIYKNQIKDDNLFDTIGNRDKMPV